MTPPSPCAGTRGGGRAKDKVFTPSGLHLQQTLNFIHLADFRRTAVTTLESLTQPGVKKGGLGGVVRQTAERLVMGY